MVKTSRLMNAGGGVVIIEAKKCPCIRSWSTSVSNITVISCFIGCSLELVCTSNCLDFKVTFHCSIHVVFYRLILVVKYWIIFNTLKKNDHEIERISGDFKMRFFPVVRNNNKRKFMCDVTLKNHLNTLSFAFAF